jgi:hypothetical protein
MTASNNLTMRNNFGAPPVTDYVIPCETIDRLSKIASGDNNPWFAALRIDDGCVIATSGQLMAVEYIDIPDGIFHLRLDAALVAQCATEAPFGSKLTVSVIDGLNIAGAKTTMGYTYPGDPCLWSLDAVNDFNRWREVVARALVPADAPNGGMCWSADLTARLAAASPSGQVVFEEVIDINRPTVIRDATDPNWFGLFMPHLKSGDYPAATLPSWFRA